MSKLNIRGSSVATVATVVAGALSMQACSPVSQEEIQAANKAGFLLAQVEKRTATVLCTVNNNLSIVESPDGSFYALSRGLPVRKGFTDNPIMAWELQNKSKAQGFCNRVGGNNV